MQTVQNPESMRDRAFKRIQERRDFFAHLTVFVLVNGSLIVIWALVSPDSIFWPMFPLLGWGVGLVMHAWDVFLAPDITEADVEREVERMTHRQDRC
jgi:hypothetical protein